MKDATRLWVELANKDLKTSKELLQIEELANIVLFHAQQTVEKMFKAVLEEYMLDIPKTHSVIRLHKIIPPEAKAKIIVNTNELKLIEEVYTESRYPSGTGLLPSGYPSIEKAKQIVNIAINIYNCILDFLNN